MTQFTEHTLTHISEKTNTGCWLSVSVKLVRVKKPQLSMTHLKVQTAVSVKKPAEAWHGCHVVGLSHNYREILEIKLWNFPKVERNDIMLNKTKQNKKSSFMTFGVTGARWEVKPLEVSKDRSSWVSVFYLGTVPCSLSSFAVVSRSQLGPALL